MTETEARDAQYQAARDYLQRKGEAYVTDWRSVSYFARLFGVTVRGR